MVKKNFYSVPGLNTHLRPARNGGNQTNFGAFFFPPFFFCPERLISDESASAEQ